MKTLLLTLITIIALSATSSASDYFTSTGETVYDMGGGDYYDSESGAMVYSY